MGNAETKEPDTLMRIWQVCRSSLLSKDAKLTYVMLAATKITSAFHCIVDPPEDCQNSLYELARNGLIRLEIDGYTFKSQIIVDSPAFLPVGTLDRTPDIQ